MFELFKRNRYLWANEMILDNPPKDSIIIAFFFDLTASILTRQKRTKNGSANAAEPKVLQSSFFFFRIRWEQRWKSIRNFI